MAKLTLGDWGEILCTGSGIIAGAAGVVVGTIGVSGYIMKKVDANFEKRRQEQAELEMMRKINCMMDKKLEQYQLSDMRYVDLQKGQGWQSNL